MSAVEKTPQAASSLAGVRARVWELLERGREDDLTSRAVDLVLSVLIVANVAAVVVETVPSIAARHGSWLSRFELVSAAAFVLEYLLRLWSCTVDPRFGAPWVGRLRFALSPIALVDLIAIVPFCAPLLLPTDLRALRLFRLFRILKLARYSESMQMLAAVFRARARELVVALFAAMLLLLTASTVMYHLERESQPEAFGSIPAAMWWAIVTLTTVGYGDSCPTTPAGRVFAGIVAVLGIGIIALPAGILASGFSEQMQRGRQPRKCPHCGKPTD
jgi:voltage-gated potassium channel